MSNNKFNLDKSSTGKGSGFSLDKSTELSKKEKQNLNISSNDRRRGSISQRVLLGVLGIIVISAILFLFSNSDQNKSPNNSVISDNEMQTELVESASGINDNTNNTENNNSVSDTDLSSTDSISSNEDVMQIDSDGDGISDLIESSLGSNPKSTDTDNDGYNDYDEILGLSNPLDEGDKPLDSDNDGLSDYFESELGSDPNNIDSDGDGFNDAIEYVYNSDPNMVDQSLNDENGDDVAINDQVLINEMLKEKLSESILNQDESLNKFNVNDSYQINQNHTDFNVDIENYVIIKPTGTDIEPSELTTYNPETVNFTDDSLLEGVVCYFKFNSLELYNDDGNLARLANLLLKNPTEIILTGHTDSTGNYQYNTALSILRAKIVNDYLISQGIDSNLIEFVGVSSDQPRSVTNYENRRVEIKVKG